MKSKQLVIDAINEILSGQGAEQITYLEDATDLRNDLNFDSFDLAELTVRLEESFGIDIFKDGIVRTAGEIFNILELKS